MNKTTIQPKLWTGSFIKICLVNFFIFVNFHALLPTFPFFITYLGGDAVTIGVATALFSIASILSRPFVGWLVDTRGRCTILVLGLIGMTLIPMGYFVSAGIALSVILRTIHGAFHAASSNASATWVTDIVPHSRMGEGLGMFGLSTALSTAIAPALGLEVMNIYGFQPFFAIAALASLISLLIGISIKNRNYICSTQPLKWSELFEKLSLPASITLFFFMIAYAVVEVYVAIYASNNHLPSGGLYFICIAVATVLSRLFLGRFIDKYGESRLVYSGNVAIIVGILLLVYFHNTPAYILSALLLGYSFGAVQPSLQTMAMHAVTPERRGAANSTFFVSFDLGIALGGLLSGFLIKWLDYDLMFLIIAFSSVLSLVYYYFFGRNHPSSFNPSNRKKSEGGRGLKLATLPTRGEDQALIVTISREFGSGGHRIGELLAGKLRVPLYDRELLKMTARESGFSEGTVAENEQSVSGSLIYDNPVQTKMFHVQTHIIRDIVARRQSCVIVGRLANFILEGEARCFNIFVYADKASRIERIVEEYKITAPEAKSLLQRNDRERSEHSLHYTGNKWGDCHYYDLMVNSSVLGVEGTAEMIYSIIRDQIKKGK